MDKKAIRKQAAEKAMPKVERALAALKAQGILVDFDRFKDMLQDDVIQVIDREAREMGEDFKGAVYFCRENYEALQKGFTAYLSFYGKAPGKPTVEVGYAIVGAACEEELSVKWSGDPMFTIAVDPCPQLNEG